MVQQESQAAGRRPLVRRVAARVLLVFGVLVTFLAVVLVVAAWTEDIAIDSDPASANAEVVSDSFTRTLVRFYTADGAEHIPQLGVLYPSGLNVGDVVRVEFNRNDTEVVRVAGRGAFVTFLPVGLTVLAVWAVIGPYAWWLRRRARESM